MPIGLEIRVPFLDQEIVEYVERLGVSLRCVCKRKWLHRKVQNDSCRPRSSTEKERFATKRRGSVVQRVTLPADRDLRAVPSRPGPRSAAFFPAPLEPDIDGGMNEV